ncbi:hypothetical protein BC830DRAFT_1078470 [Chytriomyces sp. MP71]|nr:hypothetical protein BC830DRAFT_1078470 [Chytriomyces sp. MP71]
MAGPQSISSVELILASPELKASYLVQSTLTRAAYSEVVNEAVADTLPSSLSLFADAASLLDRSVLFKTYFVKVDADAHKLEAMPRIRVPLAKMLISASTAEQAPNAVKFIFNAFEAHSLIPLYLPHLRVHVIAAGDVGSHLGKAGALQLRLDSPVSVDDQLATIGLNLSLYRLGVVESKRTAQTVQDISKDPAVTDKFNSLFKVRPSNEPLAHIAARLIRLIQRNLYILGLYPLGHQGNIQFVFPTLSNVHTTSAIAGDSPGVSVVATTPNFEEYWFNGIICNTTILGMTEFVSEFGPFDSISLQMLEDQSVIHPNLLTALFKTVFLLRQNLTLLGYALPIGETVDDIKTFEKSIRAFQQANGIKATGILGHVSRKRMTALVRDLKTSRGWDGLGDNAGVAVEDTGNGPSSVLQEGFVGTGGGSGVAAMQRGLNQLRTLGGGVGNEKSGDKRRAAAVQVEDVSIGLVLHLAKTMEEMRKAAAAKLEKKIKRQESKQKKHTHQNGERDNAGNYEGLPTKSQVKHSTSGNVMRPSITGAMMGSIGATSSSALPSTGNAYSTPKDRTLIQSLGPKRSGLALSAFKDGSPASSSHLFAKHSHRSLSPNHMSPIPSSGDEGENEVMPYDGEHPRHFAQKKILRGIKNIGMNVKRLATMGGNTITGAGVGAQRGSVDNFADLLNTKEGHDDQMQDNPEQTNLHVELPALAEEQGLALAKRQRSLSVGDLNLLLGPKRESPELMMSLETVSIGANSMDHSGQSATLGLISLRRSASESLLIPSGRNSTVSRKFSQNSDSPSAPSIKTIKSLESNLKMKQQGSKPSQGKKNTSDKKSTAKPLPPRIQISSYPVPPAISESTDVSVVTQAVQTQLSLLEQNSQMNAMVNVATNLSSPFVSVLQQIEQTSAQIMDLVNATHSNPATPVEKSIMEFKHALVSFQENLENTIMIRGEHKKQLIAGLKDLILQQQKASATLDTVTTQTMKVKYAVGLLEGRVSETEEATRVFVKRVEAVEQKLKEKHSSWSFWK